MHFDIKPPTPPIKKIINFNIKQVDRQLKFIFQNPAKVIYCSKMSPYKLFHSLKFTLFNASLLVNHP